jgi:hypothetical protein
MQTAVITPRPPRCRCDASAEHVRKGCYRLALPRPGHRRCRCRGRGRVRECAAIHRLQLMPLAPRWRTTSAAHIWIVVLPGERVPACSSGR